MLFSIQLLIILICLFYGARKGGIALGLLGGIGLVILVFVFHLQPGKPPVDVMLVIIAVVAASATLQASGGLDVMLQIAEKLLRRNPKYVSIVAPFVTCTLTILCGTGHVVYTILPIIYDVAIKNNIRPERPMAASSIGAQMGIIASPVSVAVVSLVAMLGNVTFDGKHLEFLDLLSITIPSTLLGILAIGILVGSAVKIWIKTKRFRNLFPYRKTVSTCTAIPRRCWIKNCRKATGWRCGSSWRRLPWSLSWARTPTYVQPSAANRCRWCWSFRCLCC